MTNLAVRRVSPFGHPGITAHVQLPQAYRSLSRPSSPLDAKASTVCLIAFDLKFVFETSPPGAGFMLRGLTRIQTSQPVLIPHTLYARTAVRAYNHPSLNCQRAGRPRRADTKKVMRASKRSSAGDF